MNRNTKKLQPLKKLFLLTLIIAFSSCFSQKINKTEKSYIITKYKYKDKNSWYLNLETFEYENRTKRFYSVYHINNVVFSDHDLKPLNPSVIRGKFKINEVLLAKSGLMVLNLFYKEETLLIFVFTLKILMKSLKNILLLKIK